MNLPKEVFNDFNTINWLKHLITKNFLIKGGVGKGIANQDTLADTEDDLMFFTGNWIIIKINDK